MSSPDWKNLEFLTADIQKQLSPRSDVQHNVKIPGLDSGTDRQVDVLIKDQIGQFPIRIAIECKDHCAPVDVNVVGEFQGLLNDTRISKGVLVCPGGFTKAALKLAASKGIDTYRPVDTDPHKWSCAVSLPTICDFRAARIRLRLSFSLPLPFRVPSDVSSLVLFDENDKPLGSIAETARRRWEEGKLPAVLGHTEAPLCGERSARIENGYGRIVPCDLIALLEVSRRRFFGETPVEKVKGFQDLQTGHLIANAFDLGGLDPDVVESTWLEIGEDEPPRPVALSVQGLYCLGVGES